MAHMCKYVLHIYAFHQLAFRIYKHLFTLRQRVAFKTIFNHLSDDHPLWRWARRKRTQHYSQLCELLRPFARSSWQSVILKLRFFFWFVLSKIVCFILSRLPFIKKILEGIKKSKNPIDVILELIEIVQGGKEENEENKEKEEENKETTEEKEEENSSNEEEKPKEEGENEDSGSGESDMESQEDTVNEIHHKFKINGPEEW